METGPGAPANEPSKHGLGRAGQALEPGAGYRGWETNAPNGDPGAWPPSNRKTGCEDSFSVCSKAPRIEGRGEMLVDPKRQPPHPAAAPSQLTNSCRINLQQEQACPGLRSTGVIAASAAGLWSSASLSLAESQPL